MPLFVDIEVEYRSGFRVVDLDDAWDRMSSDPLKVHAATTFDNVNNQWRSYRAPELPALCKAIIECDGLVTFNGKCWDVPILSQYARDEKIQSALKAFCGPASQRLHEDLLQIAKSLSGGRYFTLFNLAKLNLDAQVVDGLCNTQMDQYKLLLMWEKWGEYEAFQASKAWRDVSMTFALWQAFHAGALQAPPHPRHEGWPH